MSEVLEQPVLDFFRYPPIGDDDWRYGFETAVVRVLESQMLSRSALIDMANADSYDAALDLLSSTEYTLPQGSRDFAAVEKILLQRRTELRELFKDLIIDELIAEPLLAREDFANMRLALRRKLLGKPLGTDYSNDGSVPAEEFEAIFEEENYSPLPYHMQEAIEKAVLAYYQNKDVRQIDYALDSSHFEYKLSRAEQLKNIFVLELFRMQIDLTNIRTMLRLKFTESEHRDVFINGGYIEIQLLKHCLDIGYESIAALFFATPYFEAVESGVSYLASKKSFLKIERNCESHLAGFLKTTIQITAGPQPIIAYLLLKEAEIRNIRLILTAKMNALDKSLLLDRLGE
jgi:V/A-type H+-transporting ATPase subunit C